MTDTLIYETVERLIAKLYGADRTHRAAGDWQPDAWEALRASGLLEALVPADSGGWGVKPAVAVSLLRLIGYWAVPLPVAEAMLAAALVAEAGMAQPLGLVTLAPPRLTVARVEAEGDRWRVVGQAHRVGWARAAAVVMLVVEGPGEPWLVTLPTADCEVRDGGNLAGEPRDSIAFDHTVGADQVGRLAGYDVLGLHALGAALRTAMIAGAAERLLDMSVAFARTHEQFGRPIGKFQAVQQNLAVLAGEAALCRAAAEMAAGAVWDRNGVAAIAIAKARAGEAGSTVAHLAHQVHGAMGFTQDYDLHLYTKRVWAWREEFGNEAEWQELVGRSVREFDAGVWAFITAAGDVG